MLNNTIFFRIKRVERRRADNFLLGISSCMVSFHFEISLRDSRKKELIYSFLISSDTSGLLGTEKSFTEIHQSFIERRHCRPCQ